MSFRVSNERDTGQGGYRVFDEQGEIVGPAFRTRAEAEDYAEELKYFSLLSGEDD